MRLTLPLPPTANLYWRVFRGRPVQSARAKEYKRAVQLRALGNRRDPESIRNGVFSGEVVVTMTVYRGRRIGDLDNFQKVLLDALRGVAFVDDSQVVEIHARREDDPANPRVEVSVEALRVIGAGT